MAIYLRNFVPIKSSSNEIVEVVILDLLFGNLHKMYGRYGKCSAQFNSAFAGKA